MTVSALRRRPRTVAALVIGCAAGLLVVAEPAAAHTGLPAGGALDGAAHPFFGIDHVLAMVAVGVVAATAHDRRIVWLTPAGFVAGMVAGGVAGLSGIHVHGVEVAIAVSVIALGILVVVTVQPSALWLPVLAAVCGAAHGHAHSAELPTGALPYAYVAGFVAATVALLLAGTSVGIGLRRIPTARVAAGGAVAAAGVALLGGA